MFIITLVQKDANGNVASTTTTYATKREALEKLYYEMYYACNQNLPYVLVTLMDENGAIHKTEIYKTETEFSTEVTE